MNRPLIFLVQVGLSASAGYVAWRVAAHRLHLGPPSVWIGLFVFGAAFYVLAAFRRGGMRAVLSALLPIAAAALFCLLVAALLWLVRQYGELAVANPALTAAWIIVLTGAVGAVQRLVAGR